MGSLPNRILNAEREFHFKISASFQARADLQLLRLLDNDQGLPERYSLVTCQGSDPVAVREKIGQFNSPKHGLVLAMKPASRATICYGQTNLRVQLSLSLDHPATINSNLLLLFPSVLLAVQGVSRIPKRKAHLLLFSKPNLCCRPASNNSWWAVPLF